MVRYFFLLLLIISPFFLKAQNRVDIRGALQDSTNRKPLAGATVVFTQAADSTSKKGTISNVNGEFQVSLPKGKYLVSVSFIGFKKFQKNIMVRGSKMTLPIYYLVPDEQILDEVKVIESVTPILQKGDTTIYNSEAYKVNSDASSEKLLSKMQGFYMVNGQLQVNGQKVKEILVDGKKFFGEDVQKALQTIPADIVKKVEVFKHESDESKLTGVEDKEPAKTVNLETKAKGRDLYFGDVDLGVGKDSRYVANGTINRFAEKSRFSVTARSNNVAAPVKINKNPSGKIAISGNDMRYNGISTNVNLIGKTKLGLSYRYSESDNSSFQSRKTEYLINSLAGLINSDTTQSVSNDKRHRFSFRWHQLGKKKHRFLWSSSASVGKLSNASEDIAYAFQNGELDNLTENANSSNNLNYSISNRLRYSLRLDKEGRSLSVGLSHRVNNAKKEEARISQTSNKDNEIAGGTNNELDSKKESQNFSVNVSFTEKISELISVQTEYNYSQAVSFSNDKNYLIEDGTEKTRTLDIENSNTFENKRFENNTWISLRFSKGNWRGYLGTEAKHTRLRNKESFPEELSFEQSYFFFTPSVSGSYFNKGGKYINLYYQSMVDVPMLRDLQEIVDITNPLYLTTGNKDLQPTRNHMLLLTFRNTNQKTNNTLMCNLNVNYIEDAIARNTIIATNDTLINEQYILPTGGQYSYPINLDGRFTIGGSFSWARPLKWLKSQMNLRTSCDYFRTPSIINNAKNIANRVRVGEELTLSSNISEKVDFSVRSLSEYSIVNENTATAQSNYFRQSFNTNIYWNFYKGLIFKTSLHYDYTGKTNLLPANNRLYINSSISTKLFRNKKGELSLSFYDYLNQENERIRNVSDISIQEIYSPRLSKFVMLSFSYKLRNKNSM